MGTLVTLCNPPWHGKHQRHRNISRIFGQNPRRIGDGNSPLARGSKVDMINPCAKGGNQL